MTSSDAPALHTRLDLCAEGQCNHAASPRNPCRCPCCNLETRKMVLRYREEYEQQQARNHGIDDEIIKATQPKRAKRGRS